MVDRETTASILRSLSAQGDPKFVNSEFYQFITKLHTGQATIHNKQVVEHDFGDI